MKTNKAVVVALAAAILASGGAVAGSVTTATPAYAAESGSTSGVTAPKFTMAYPSGETTAVIAWSAPTNVQGRITSYKVTIKEAGKPDRIFLTENTKKTITGLTADTTYTIQVRANIVSPTGVKTTSPTASTVITTHYSWTAVEAVAPNVAISGVTNNGMTATWKTPEEGDGWISGYTAVIKQGTNVIQRATVPDQSEGYKNNVFITAGLTANTAYTLEVTTNAQSYDGKKKDTSSVTTVKFVTAAKASSVVVAKPSAYFTNLTAYSAVIAWTNPPVTGGSINMYGITVTDRITGEKTAYRHSTVPTRSGLSSLKPGTKYVVELIAKGVSADGKSSTYSVTKIYFTTKSL